LGIGIEDRWPRSGRERAHAHDHAAGAKLLHAELSSERLVQRDRPSRFQQARPEALQAGCRSEECIQEREGIRAGGARRVPATELAGAFGPVLARCTIGSRAATASTDCCRLTLPWRPSLLTLDRARRCPCPACPIALLRHMVLSPRPRQRRGQLGSDVGLL